MRPIFATALFIALAATQAHADLSLNYTGVTYGSTLGGVAIADGTSFELHAIFDTATDLSADPGIGQYGVKSVTAKVGGSTYSSSASYASGFVIFLVDASYFDWGLYQAEFAQFGTGAFNPQYGGSTTSLWSADAPSPTVFGPYQGSVLFTSIKLPTLSAGNPDLVLSYYQPAGVTASVTQVAATPEPAFYGLLTLGLGVMNLARRRRS